MTKLQWFGAFVVSIISNLLMPRFTARMGIKTFEATPANDNTLTDTLKVAAPIKPTGTPGSVANELALLEEDDQKVFIKADGPASDSMTGRVILMPVTAVNVTVAPGGTLIGTITRDDSTKPTSAHSVTVPGGLAGDNVAFAAALTAAVAAQKPKRNLGSLINAAIDALGELPAATDPFVIVVDQTGDGSVKVYAGADIDEDQIGGALADVELTVPVVESTTRSGW
jgi:hypothetical protein